MSQIDDSAHVDGGPAEPDPETPEVEVKAEPEPEKPAKRGPAKKAGSRSGPSRSRSSGSSTAKASGKANGQTGAKSTTRTSGSGGAASPRKRAASTRQRSAGLSRGRATATEKAAPTGEEAADEPAPEVTDQSAPELTDQSGPEVTDQSGPEVTDQSAPELTDQSGPEVTDQSAPEVTDQSVVEDRVPPPEPEPEPEVKPEPEPGAEVETDPVQPAATEPLVDDQVTDTPEHDAWLDLDYGEQDLIDGVPGPRSGGSKLPRWTGRWIPGRGEATGPAASAAEDTGMVTGVPGLGPDWADTSVTEEAEEAEEAEERPPEPSADEEPAEAADPAYLATLPPPPPAPPSAPGLGFRFRRLRAAASAGSVRVSASAAGLLAGRRRAVPGDDEQPPPAEGAGGEDSLDPAYLATLPPPPAAPAPLAEPVGDLGELEDWSLPDWTVSGTTGEGDPGPVVDLSVSDVNSDRAVITPPDDTVVADPTEEIAPTEEIGAVEGTREIEETDEATEPAEFEPALAGPPSPGWLSSRHARRREWRRVERARRHAARHSVRFPIFTRSILLWMILFAMSGMAAGGTAAVFWTHFNTQIAELQDATQDFDKRSDAAEKRIEGLRNDAVSEIENRMKELAPALAEPRTVQAGKILSPYVWFVSTLDENGVASVGTAFPVASDQRSTWLLTSFNVVRAGTVRPAPPIKLRKDPEEVDAELVSWDAANDLALIRMDRGSQPTLEWAPEDAQAKVIGNRLYIVTGFGAAGATLNSTMAIDQNSKGVLHDGRIGTAAQGGPIVTTDGKVIGVASLVYQPLGFDPGELHYAVSVRRACDVLLTCTLEARRIRPPAGG
jgi:S1-C subfamily serine protease